MRIGSAAMRQLQWVLPALVFLTLGLSLFCSAGRDDAYITYWPARTLANLGEILNYNGERVEQSSSMLQVLVLALISVVLRVDPAVVGRPLTLLFGLGCVCLAWRLAAVIDRRAAFGAALLTATHAHLLYWSLGGLETTLMPLCALVLILSHETFLRSPPSRSSFAASFVATAFFVLVRPEAPLVLLGLLLVLLTGSALRSIRAIAPPHRVLALLGMACVCSVLVFGFRFLYFDRWFPQPVVAKASGLSWEGVELGLGYLRFHLLRTPLLAGSTVVTLAAAAYLLARGLRSPAGTAIGLALSYVLTYVAFIAASGGDWMEGGRFAVHLLPVAASLVPVALSRLARGRRTFAMTVALLCLVQLKVVWDFAARESTGMPIWRAAAVAAEFARQHDGGRFSWFERTNRVHMREMPVLYHLGQVIDRVQDRTQGKVVVMSSQMGMIVYHLARGRPGQVQTVDLFGLTDRYFTECPVLVNAPRTPWGLGLSPGIYFKNREVIERECGAPRPDVLFNLFYYQGQLDQVVRAGYEIVYLQTGSVGNGSTRLPGAAVDAEQYIAVRKDLALGFERTELDFGHLDP